MGNIQTILAFDTSIGITTVAVVKNGEALSYLREDDPHAQAKRLVPMIEEALTQAGLWHSDMDAIASTVGPGNFTGLRVGFSTARALALSTCKPFIGLTSLEVMASAYAARYPDAAVLAAVNAGRGQVYAQLFNGGTATSEPRMLDYDAVHAILPQTDCAVVGNAETVLRPHLQHASFVTGISYADAKDIAALALKTGPRHDIPLYLRPADAKLPEKLDIS